MLCAKGLELIKVLDRTPLDSLPLYDNDNIRLVLLEMRKLYEQNVEIVNTTRDNLEDSIFALKVRHKSLKRNRRCLLAYLWNRLERLQDMRWEIGAILPQEIKHNLSSSEELWFANYCKSLANYMKSIGDGGLNLAQDMKPPKSLYVEVRSLVDAGELDLDDGEVVCLKKNTQYMMLRSQCESLIRQGILQHVNAS